jgi:predicted histidine transporter YuiF (NhaC family)
VSDVPWGVFSPHRLAAICYISVAVVVARSVWKRRVVESRSVVTVGWTSLFVITALAVDRGLAFSDSSATKLRYRAVRYGWYEERKSLQVVLMGVAVVAAVVLIRSWWRLRLERAWSVTTGAVIGLVMLRLLRLVSLHQIDNLFELGLGAITAVVLMELTLLSVAAWGAFAVLRADHGEELGCTDTAPMG